MERSSDGGLDEAGDRQVEHVPLDELVQSADLDAGELADVDQDVAVAADVVVDDVEAAAVVELGVLQAFGGIQLAVAAGGVVQHLGERAQEVLVVVEHLVVVAGCAGVPACRFAKIWSKSFANQRGRTTAVQIEVWTT